MEGENKNPMTEKVRRERLMALAIELHQLMQYGEELIVELHIQPSIIVPNAVPKLSFIRCMKPKWIVAGRFQLQEEAGNGRTTNQKT